MDIHDILPTPAPEAPALSRPQMFGSCFLHRQRDFNENERASETETGTIDACWRDIPV